MEPQSLLQDTPQIHPAKKGLLAQQNLDLDADMATGNDSDGTLVLNGQDQDDTGNVALSQENGLAGVNGASLDDNDTPNTLSPQASPKPSPQKSTKKGKSLDLASDEAFPALPTSSTPRASPLSAWANLSTKKTAAAQATSLSRSGSSTQVSSVSALLNIPVAALQAQFAPRQNSFGPNNAFTQTLKTIMTKTNTELQTSTNKKTGVMTVLIKGKQEAVQKAKRECMANLTTKFTKVMQVPVSARPHIVGSKGKTIQGITGRTAVKIQLPPLPTYNDTDSQDRQPSDDDEDDEEEQIPVTLVGDKEGILMAMEEINKIVSERSSNSSSRLGFDVIPPSYYPFISGPHGSRLNEWTNKYNVKITVPPVLSSEDDSDDRPRRKKEGILIQGNRENVKSLVAEMQHLVYEMNRTTQTLTVSIPKRQHKYVIGPKGSNLSDLLETTGCIVELPPPSDSSENVTVRGPGEKLVQALGFIMEKANSIAVTDLDLTTLVPSKDHDSALFLLKYFLVRDRTKLKSFEIEASNTVISFPSRRATSEKNADVTLEISGKNRNDVEVARQRIIDYVNTLGSFYYSLAPIPMELHRHPRIRQTVTKLRENLPNAPGPKPCVIDTIYPGDNDENEDLIVLLFEPNKKKVSVGKQLVEYVKDELVKASEEAADFTTRTITIPVKFHRHVIGPKGATLQNIIKECNTSSINLTVKVGSSKKNTANGETEEKKQIALDDDTIVVKGMKDEVEKAVEMIKKIVDEVKHMEVMSSFTQTVAVEAKYLPNIIGKAGSQIQKLKDIPGVVKIDVEDNKENRKPNEMVNINVQGTKKAAETVKESILERVAQLADATTITLNIPQEYHRQIIGAQGKYVKRLESKYGVRIQFPKDSADSESTEDLAAVDDKEKLNPNTVIVKGGKKGVEGAKGEILELIEYEKQYGHTVQFNIPSSSLPSIIGKSGSRITQLKQFTNTKIDFPKKSDSADAEPESEVTITGTQKDIGLAKKVILKLATHFAKNTGSGQPWITESITIPKSLHRKIIGAGGKAIRDLLAPYNAVAPKRSRSKSPSKKVAVEVNEEVDNLVSLLMDGINGTEESASKNNGDENVQVTVRFPKAGKGSASDEDQVQIRGISQELVDAVKADLEKLVEELLNQTSVAIHVPTSFHAGIIGRGGSNVRRLQEELRVDVQFYDNIPQGEVPVNDLSEFDTNEKLGSIKISGSKDNCDATVKDILSKLPHSKVIQVPTARRRDIIGNGASNLKYIRNKYNVSVDLPPQRIDQETEENIDPSAVENWTLKGDKSALVDVEKYITGLISQTASGRSGGSKSNTQRVTRKVPIPQQYHRHIIGRAGSTITKIRDETNCFIDVPKQGSSSEDVVVKGTAEGVELAEEMIKEVVREMGGAV